MWDDFLVESLNGTTQGMLQKKRHSNLNVTHFLVLAAAKQHV